MSSRWLRNRALVSPTALATEGPEAPWGLKHYQQEVGHTLGDHAPCGRGLGGLQHHSHICGGQAGNGNTGYDSWHF